MFDLLIKYIALRHFLWLKSGYYGFPVFLVRLRAYSVNFVSFVVETSLAAGYNQMVTDVHHRDTERTENSQRTPGSITHSIQRGTKYMLGSGQIIAIIASLLIVCICSETGRTKQKLDISHEQIIPRH